MRAGLTQYRVGTFDDGKGQAVNPGMARVVITLPVEGNQEAEKTYHNRLMMLCGLSLSKLTQAIAKRAESRPGQSGAPAAGAESAAAVSGRSRAALSSSGEGARRRPVPSMALAAEAESAVPASGRSRASVSNFAEGAGHTGPSVAPVAETESAVAAPDRSRAPVPYPEDGARSRPAPSAAPSVEALSAQMPNSAEETQPKRLRGPQRGPGE